MTASVEPAPGRLSGLVAVVTGAGRGLGRALALRLAREGASVVVNDIDAAGCAETADLIGPGSAAVPADLTTPSGAGAVIDGAIGRFGRLDILVNNAALFATAQPRPFTEIEPDELDRVVSANTRLVLLPCQRAVGHMARQGGGRIVNVVSASILAGPAGLVPYVASKGAVFAMTRVLATECGPLGVTVNSVAPGLLVTDGSLANTSPEAFDLQRSRRPVARDGGPQDVEEAVLFLVSPGSSFVTGQMLVVNGGAQYW
ncbi:MAG: SDR family NAD(P)-dependent oxidoreductase [Acidimicrobiales bacterium]